MAMPRAKQSVVKPLGILFIVFFIPFNILHFSQAAPTQSEANECPITCKAGQGSVINFEPGEYVYEYESDITTEVTLTRPESKSTNVKANVVLTAYSPCDLVLKVQKSTLKTSSGQEEQFGLENSPVRFTLEDGAIGSVCITKDDSTYSANIKRSIISLLQNRAADHSDEVVESDFSGSCPTHYEQSGNTYVKTRNLNACNHRSGGNFPLTHGVPYNVASERNSVPSVESRQSCEQTLENGIVKSVNCTETHKSGTLEPIPAVGLVTRVKVSLTLSSSKKGTIRRALPNNLVKSCIFFDDADTSDARRAASAEKTARDTLERICAQIRPDGISADVPSLLITLKKSFDHLTVEAAQGIYDDIKNGQLCSAQSEKLKKLYVDTAAVSGTDAGINVVAPLYQSKELGKLTTRYFYIKTTFAPRPTEKALKAISNIIDTSSQDSNKRLLLAASGLAYRYCKKTNSKCGDVPEYVELVDKIATIAKKSCLTRSNEDGKAEKAIGALQALGNLQTLTEGAVGAISGCLGSTNRIKIHALEAFRRDSCENRLKLKAQEIFANKNAPSNIRISAFVASLRCLQSDDVKAVQDVLDSEESLQVGGFIQSLLRNLVKNASPSALQLKDAAQKLNNDLKFPRAIRKSRNLQSSFFNAGANLGYSAQGNVLFGEESVIPRQLSANLTVDFFGKSYNLLEVGLNLENFEQLQESLFGPNGKFSSSNPLISSPKSFLNSILKQGREKREVSSTSSNREGGVADLFIRILGTTVGVVSLNTNRGPKAVADLKENLDTLVKGTLGSSSKEVDIVKSIQLLNIDVRTPTVAGFALSLSAQGSTVPSLEYKRQGQRPDDSGTPLDLSVKIQTNIATGIKLKHSVVAGPFESGLQYEASLRSGGGLDFSIHRDSKKFEAKLNLPHETVRAFEVTANTYWIRRTPSRPNQKTDFRPSLHVMPGPENCLEDGLVNWPLLVGLKPCVISNIHLDEPAAVLGKQYLSFKLKKSEPSMQGYSLVVDKEINGDDKKYTLTLDTPGSQTNRKVTFKVHSIEDANAGTKKIQVQVDTPVKGADAKFTYERTNSDSLKSIQARLELPNLSVLSVHGQIKFSNSGSNQITYEPQLTFEYPRRDGKKTSLQFLTGKIVRNKGEGLTFDLAHQFPDKIVSISPLDIFLKGAVQVSRGDDNSDFKYELKNIELGARNRDQTGSPTPVLVLNGQVKRSGSNFEDDLDVKYGLDLEHHLTIHENVLLEPGRVKLETKMTSSRVFFLNFDLKADVRHDKAAGSYNSDYSLKYGRTGKTWELSSKTDAVAKSLQNFDIQHELKLRDSETYNVALKSHVKNVIDQETIVDLKLLNGEDGSKGKALVSFHKEAAKNNDFKLHLLAECKQRDVSIDFTHQRTTIANPPKEWTSSYKHESELSSVIPGVPAISKQKLVTVVNFLNKDNKKGVSIKADVGSDPSNPTYSFEGTLKCVPEKYSAKVSVKDAGTEIALLDANLAKNPDSSSDTRFLNPTFQIQAVLKNVAVISLTREVPSEGHGITKLDADIQKTGRQILLVVSRHCEGDLHKVKLDLKWDAKRDASQHLSIDSVTKISHGSIIIDSKNEVTLIGNKVQLNVNGKIPTHLKQGEHSLSVELVSVNGQSYKVDYKNKLNIKPDARTSEAKLDIHVPELKETSITWNIKSNKPNLPQFVVDITADVAISTEGVKNHGISAQFKSSQEEHHRRSLQVKGDVTFGGVANQIVVDSKLVFGSRFLSTNNKLQLGSTEYGIAIEGEASTADDGSVTKNIQYTLTNIPLPTATKVQKIEGKVTEKCKITSLQSFEIAKQHEIKFDDQPTFNYKYDISLLDGKLIVDAAAEANRNNLLKAKLHGNINKQLFEVSGNIGVGPTQVAVKAALNRENPLRNFEIKAETSSTGFGLKFGNIKNADTFGLVNFVKYRGKTAKLEGEITLSSQQKALIVNYNGGDLGYSNVGLKINSANGLLNYNLEVTNVYLSSPLKIQGDLIFYKENLRQYGGTVNIEYGWKATGKANLEIQDNRRKLTLNAGVAGDVANVLTLEYTKQSTGSTKVYEGEFSSDLNTHLFDIPDMKPIKGTFKLESTRLEGAERGFELKSTIQFSQLPINIFRAGTDGTLAIELKATNLEIRTKVLASNQPEGQEQGKKFRSLEFQVKRDEKSPLMHKIKFIRRNNVNSENREVAHGIVLECTGTPQNFQHTTKIVLGDENANTLAVRVHGKGAEDNCEAGIDIKLPKRTIGASMSKQGPSVTLSAWLEPEKKLTVKLDYEKLTTDDGAKGYAYKAVIQHPSLAKDLVITRRVVRFGSSTVLDSTTELDLFQDPSNKITIVAKLTKNDASNNQLKAKFSVKSEGLGLFVEGNGDVSKTEGNEDECDSYHVNLRYSFKNRNGDLKSRNVELVLSHNRQSLLIGDRSAPEFLVSRHVRNPEDHRRRRSAVNDNKRDVRYELHLPGMKDNRIVDVHLDGGSLPHVSVNTFNSDPATKRAFEIFLGFPTETELIFRIQRSVTADTHDLIKLSAALNSSQILSLKAKWDLKKIQEVVVQAMERFENTGDGVQSTSEALIGELSQDVQQTLSKLATALPNLIPLRDHVRSEVQEIKQEWEENSETHQLSEVVSVIVSALQIATEPLRDVLKNACNLPEYLKQLSTNPAFVKKYDKAVKNLRVALGHVIRITLKTLRPILKQLQELMDKISARFGLDFNAGSENTIKKAQTIADSFWAKAIEALLSRTDDLNRFVEQSSVSQEFKDLVLSVIQFAVQTLKGDVVDVTARVEEILTKFKIVVKKALSEVLTVDLKNGVITLAVPLPKPVNSWVEIRNAVANIWNPNY